MFNTNIWLADDQLLRLAYDLSSWNRIDDLWASYVLDALLGWEMHRTGTLPVDIGMIVFKGMNTNT
jgi:hypothetical protein